MSDRDVKVIARATRTPMNTRAKRMREIFRRVDDLIESEGGRFYVQLLVMDAADQPNIWLTEARREALNS